MQYSDLIDFISTNFQVPETNNNAAQPFTDPNANLYLPRAIDFAEQGIYSVMNFLATRQANSGPGYNLTANSRSFVLPSVCMAVEGVSVITPAGTLTPAAGKRNPVEIASLDMIDMLFPSEQGQVGVPTYCAPLTDATWVFGQTPDQAYPLEITGLYRPKPISWNNVSTYLSLNYPQLLTSAIAVAWLGYQRDYGAASDDPKAALSWKAEYDRFLSAAEDEERRRRGLSQQTASTAPRPQSDPAAN